MRPSRHDHMLFTENSLIHVRKFCTLKPPLGHDSATEDISATFSMLVSMQGFFPCLSSMICSLVIEGVAPEWFCIEIGMQQNFACSVSIIWGSETFSPTPQEACVLVIGNSYPACPACQNLRDAGHAKFSGMPGMPNSLACRACHNLGHAGHAKIGLWHALNAQVIIPWIYRYFKPG